MNSQLVEIASWRLVSELFRRYPGKFNLIETHPGGGQYDCLTLFSNQHHIADFNRIGTFRLTDNPSGEPSIDIWRLMAEENVQVALDQVCRRLGLSIPAKVPASTPEVITYRFVAAFLSHSVFGKARWECRNGYFDSSGMEGSGVSSAFDHFPAVQDRLRVPMPSDVLQTSAYRFWFLLKDGNPVACIETTGTAWIKGGQSFDLAGLYKKEKLIWPIISAVMGHMLP